MNIPFHPVRTPFLSHLSKGLALTVMAAGLAHADVVLKWDFQGSEPFHHLAIEGEPPRLVDDPVTPGRQVMLAELLTTSERTERSEVRWDGLKPGCEYWVGAEAMVPESNVQEFICLFQIGPIKYRDGDKANGGYIQTLQRRNKTGGTDWVFRGFFDRFGAPGAYQYLGDLPFGKWQKWVFHVIPRTDETGLIEAWLEGRKVYTLKGKSAKEDGFVALPLKWGVYIGTGNTLKQNARAYYRKVVLADGDSSLDQVTKELR